MTCPVVQVKTVETDGYEAVQIAFDSVADRKVSKAERGHLEKAGVSAHRHLVELRGQSELQVGESVTVEAFEPGDKVKVTLRFRGRELAHQELGWQVLQRVKTDTEPLAKVESEPRMEGRQMVMVLAPR